MSSYMTQDDIINLGAFDAAEASTVAFAPGRPVDVHRVILVTTEAQVAADAIVTVSVRDVDDGNSTTIGTFTIPLAGSALDNVQYVNLVYPATTGTTASDGSLVFTGYDPGGFVQVNPGQEIAFVSNAGGSSGIYTLYVEYKDQGFSGERVAHAVELTFTAA
jgi:hypothetical protein